MWLLHFLLVMGIKQEVTLFCFLIEVILEFVRSDFCLEIDLLVYIKSQIKL